MAFPKIFKKFKILKRSKWYQDQISRPYLVKTKAIPKFVQEFSE
jgi:hypothetical protein